MGCFLKGSLGEAWRLFMFHCPVGLKKLVMGKVYFVLVLTLFSTQLHANLTFDGVINEAAWGGALATSAGGPSPGFGAGHELNAIYIFGDENNIHFGIAGNVQNGNRILIFIDSKSGGYNTGNFGRTGAPTGLSNFNSGITFDSGFEPDYCLTIGTNASTDNYFADLYTLSGTAGMGGGPNAFLGDSNTSSSFGASPENMNETRGFEISIPKLSLGYVDGEDIEVMAMYISDAGFLSNQFLTRANSDQSNFGGGAVNFNTEPPGAVGVAASSLPVQLTHFTAQAKGKQVDLNWQTATEQNNDHFELQRSADGRSWAAIGKITGRGTTQQEQAYDYTDQRPLPGLSYYRLKQVDYDGAFEYHGPVSVRRGIGDGGMKVFPNPVGDRLYLVLPDADPEGQLRLVSGLGQEVGRWPAAAATDGLPVADLPAGVYLLQWLDGRGEARAEALVVR